MSLGLHSYPSAPDKEELVQVLKTLRVLQEYGGGAAGIGLLTGNPDDTPPLSSKDAQFTYSVLVFPRRYDWLHRVLLRLVRQFLEQRGFYNELARLHGLPEKQFIPEKE